MSNFLLIILTAVAVYFFLVFVVLRLMAPFTQFGGYELSVNNNLPPEVRQAIVDLENKSTDEMSYLREVYGFVLGRWEHSRFKAATQLSKIFKKDLSEIWHTKGFVYCTTINFVVYTLLANSRFFTPQDVKVRHVFLNFVPHQYLRVNVLGKWMDVDPAGAGIRGKPLGTHQSLFG